MYHGKSAKACCLPRKQVVAVKSGNGRLKQPRKPNKK